VVLPRSDALDSAETFKVESMLSRMVAPPAGNITSLRCIQEAAREAASLAREEETIVDSRLNECFAFAVPDGIGCVPARRCEAHGGPRKKYQ